MLHRGETIEYESAYGRRYPEKGAEGKRGTVYCVLKLSGKRTEV